MMKISSKLLKSTVTMLSLITLTGTIAPIIANPTIVQAKKAKKKHYVTAKNKYQFKFGYAYTYNKKKHCYIGHKMSKKERQKFNMPKEQKVQKAKSNYDVPNINNFNNTICSQYSLLGYRWNKINLTFNDNHLNGHQQELAENSIEKINNLNIIKLSKTNKKADITIQIAKKADPRVVGQSTYSISDDDKYKNINLYEIAEINIYNNSILTQVSENIIDYDTLFKHVVLHEVGHCLGLKHNPTQSRIMNVTDSRSEHITDPDQDYINDLAILYQN